eukprot:TRINITY_DN1236_c0_g1_i1.p1 TRINITY_DN1236_c0_g1~~TRINITY_DN1236_c0_g1_i1.p1  ORF type:complete len:581 (-),score=124.40 TRINITY_DN1236_c0_g1_i1:41-1723(-)
MEHCCNHRMMDDAKQLHLQTESSELIASELRNLVPHGEDLLRKPFALEINIFVHRYSSAYQRHSRTTSWSGVGSTETGVSFVDPHILETWVFRFEPAVKDLHYSIPSGKSAADLASQTIISFHRRIVILLRSIYAKLRMVPGFQLSRKIQNSLGSGLAMGYNLYSPGSRTQNVSFSTGMKSDAFDRSQADRPDLEAENYFSVVACPVGRLMVSMRHLREIPTDMFVSKLDLRSHIINDHIPLTGSTDIISKTLPSTLVDSAPQFRAIEQTSSTLVGHRGTKSAADEVRSSRTHLQKSIDDETVGEEKEEFVVVDDDDDDHYHEEEEEEDEHSFDHTIERAEKNGIPIPFLSISPMLRAMHQDSHSLPSSLPEEVINPPPNLPPHPIRVSRHVPQGSRARSRSSPPKNLIPLRFGTSFPDHTDHLVSSHVYHQTYDDEHRSFARRMSPFREVPGAIPIVGSPEQPFGSSSSSKDSARGIPSIPPFASSTSSATSQTSTSLTSEREEDRSLRRPSETDIRSIDTFRRECRSLIDDVVFEDDRVSIRAVLNDILSRDPTKKLE